MSEKLTTNISREECMCHCKKCGNDTADYELIKIVQDTCDHFAAKLKMKKVWLDVIRVFSCPWWNGKKKGVYWSLHEDGRAMDFNIREVSLEDVFRYLQNKYMNNDRYEIIIYDTHIHFGIERTDDND